MCSRYPTVFLKVGLVSHDHNGDVDVVLDANNLLAKFGELVKAAEAGNGEDEEEPLT